MLSIKSSYIGVLFISLRLISCKKLISIPPAVGTITSSQVFSTDDQAVAAVSGIYFKMINSYRSFSSSGITIFSGMSADELIPFDQNINDLFAQFEQNQLVSTNSIIEGNFWTNAYSIIYSANAIIEGLKGYSGVHDSVKNELTGEVEFIKAFCDFYLVNLFGNIPLVNTINWQKTNLLSRTPASQIYQEIITDLKDAQNRLPNDYSLAQGQRIIPNKWAATALLARVYLFQQQWDSAEVQSTILINNASLYTLSTDLNQIFTTNSSEAIWQLQQDNSGYGSSLNATPDGFFLIPIDSTKQPFAYLTDQLLQAFEAGDRRKSSWIDSTIYNNIKYCFPYKYKIGPAQAKVNGPYTEYYMVLRLAEQYLIRSEARARQNKLADAISDLNIIRLRAGLSSISTISQTDLLSAIAHERQIELFAEWGNRWLDLKRTNQAITVLASIKPKWSYNDTLYPIPRTELLTDPNLTQNPGYDQ